MFPHKQLHVVRLWQEYCRSDVVFSSMYPISRRMILVCPVTGEVNSDHWIKVLFAKLLTVELSILLCC